MAIQNQGFRRDLNLKETEDDQTAFDNLAGSGTSKDISFLQNNLRNISSIPFYAVDSDGFFSSVNDKVIGITSITVTGNTDVDGNKTTSIQVSLINSHLIKFGDLVKISGITGAGLNIVNGEFSVVGTSNDLKTFSFTKEGIDFTETYTSVTGISFSLSASDIFSFTKDDVINVNEEVKLVGSGTTILSPNTDYYVSNSDGLTKFKLSTSPSTVGFNTITIAGGAALTPDNFQFNRKDPVHQQQIINYIQPDIQDDEFSYLDGQSINDAMDDTQTNIESAEFFMAKKYRGDADTTTTDPIAFEGSVVINDPNNYNNLASNITDNNPVRRSPGVYIGDTRAFSSDNNPWNKVGTALTTSSEEVSIGELAFLDGTNSMVITGIGTDIRPVSGEIASSFTHKIPVKVQDANGNQESYFLLLTQN
tara:strand:- start:321 stop:1583 length:1263 start_codon:yes stop_codon:yes gene_type:complete